MVTKLETWEKIVEDKAFFAEILKMPKGEAMAAIKAKGYDVNDDDMQEMADVVKEVASKINEDGELSEEDLAQISGGGHIKYIVAGVAIVLFVAFAGGVAGLYAGAVALAAW